MTELRMHGISAAVHAPFADDGTLNLGAVETQCSHLLARGVTSVFVNGSTGESHSLTTAERADVARRWLRVADGTGMCVTVHVGSNSLEDAASLAVQALLQAPQFAGSSRYFTHTLPHRSWPAGQTHLPAPQKAPPAHLMPQPPQLSLSDWESMHAPAQEVVPVAQAAWHLPEPQVALVPAQTVPQAPQFFGSVSVSVQAELHSVVPVAQPQLPPMQALPPVQVVPHVPQFLLSDFLSTQTPEHASRGAAQDTAQAPTEQI